MSSQANFYGHLHGDIHKSVVLMESSGRARDSFSDVQDKVEAEYPDCKTHRITLCFHKEHKGNAIASEDAI
jgi:hypothetical protein